MGGRKGKDFWNGNSPDLNLVENVWSMMEEKGQCPSLAINQAILVRKIKEAWDNVNL